MAKVSIELESEGVAVATGRVINDPTQEQLILVFLGCLAGIEEIGDAKEILEVVKVRFMQLGNYRDLRVSITVILRDPLGDVKNKLEDTVKKGIDLESVSEGVREATLYALKSRTKSFGEAIQKLMRFAETVRAVTKEE